MMKKTFLLVIAVLLSTALYAKPAAEYSAEYAAPSQAAPLPAVEDPSYAFGSVFGYQFKDSGITFNYEEFAAGFRDAIEGNPKLSENEALVKAQGAYTEAYERKVEIFRTEETRFLAENAKRAGIVSTESGLQYEVITEGSGEKPLIADSVEVNYEGTLVDGTIFDSSYLRGESAEFDLYAVIDGWAEGLMLMNAGSTYRLYIPSALAYGEEGAGDIIPPYATLIFKVELLSVTKDETEDDADEGAD
jgi:FKBP-type peptidyl-prolyl cis-trans isomerase